MTAGDGRSRRRRAHRAVGYVSRDSFLHLLDPRTKLLTLIVISIAAFATTSPVRTALLFAFVAGLAVVAGLGRQFSRSLLLLLPLLIFILVIDGLFPREAWGPVYFSAQIGPFTPEVTPGGLLFAAAMGIRVIVIGGISFLFVMTTSYTDLVASLRTSRLPPVIAFSLGYALKSMTALTEDLRNIMDAQRSRALEFDRGTLIKNRRKLMALGIPMTVSVLNRARYVTEAMQSRGFASTPKPTCYRPPHPGKCDVLLLVVLVVSILGIAMVPV
ncbi:MAG: energy-coupling factor transporter transmembrane protein EcfT [Methanomicrobiaceae archaeon]|uniref:energy-coupling factor transporter transmembrane component T family protein n=1 Tax=Methanoculleus sp. TaxID=90427 RepID=UPI00320C77E9|nr:energy-coupling factor transporter transmembrane protein EcfT [Methanomicrobiaceae archaeon]